MPLAVIVVAAALLLTRTSEVPLAERRPADGVGELVVGDAEPVVYERACPALSGIRVAGGPADQAALRSAVASLCNAPLHGDALGRLRRFAEAGGVVRFGLFERSGVDVTSALDASPPVIYPNVRFGQTEPSWIGPLLVYETTFFDVDRTTAAGILDARRAELRACEALIGSRRQPQGCRDARALLDLPDPLAALREAGYH